MGTKESKEAAARAAIARLSASADPHDEVAAATLARAGALGFSEPHHFATYAAALAVQAEAFATFAELAESAGIDAAWRALRGE